MYFVTKSHDDNAEGLFFFLLIHQNSINEETVVLHCRHGCCFCNNVGKYCHKNGAVYVYRMYRILLAARL